ncbi:MAG TPA: response regulator [Verrucomicrobiae bacterium]|nr:response regulator [Verrucomicrobiae bacterium]
MKTFIASLLGAECGVLAAHWLGRRWGALPVGLLLGCLVAGGATLRSWQVLSADVAPLTLDPLGMVFWANAYFTLLLIYVHDGSPRVRSLFLGCVFVFAAVAFGHWALIRNGAAANPGTWPLIQCYVAQALAFACVLVSVCLSYQLLANRTPFLSRWLRFYVALVAASCVSAVVLGAFFEGARPGLGSAIRRDMAQFVFSTALLVPLGEIYLRYFSLLRSHPEKRRPLFELVRWLPSYLAREHTEDRHIALLRSLPDLAFVVNEHGDVVEALNADDANLQPPPSTLRDCRLEDVFSAEVAARLHEAVRDALDTGRTREIVYTLAGGARFFSALVSAYHDPVARENRAIVLARDQSGTRHGMQSLEAEARRFRDAFGAMPAALFLANAEGRILLSGGSDADALALLPKPDESPDPRDPFAMTLADCLSHGSACVPLKSPEHHAGRHFALVARLVQPRREGEPATIAGVVADIGPLARAWEEQADRERLDSLSTFAGRAAHDINNLLVGITGHASLAARNISPVSRARLNVEQLLKAAEQTTELTRRLLAYAGHGPSRLRPIDVSDLVRHAQPQLARELPKGCTLQIDAGPSVALVRGETANIETALTALVENAAQAYGEAGGTVRILTGSGSPLPEDSRYAGEPIENNDAVWIEVADQGEGIPPDSMRRIFDACFTTRQGHGGLGLAEALGLMRAFNGGIAAWSVPGRGSRFRLCFPPHRPPAPQPPPKPLPGFRGSGLALVVDDEESVRSVAAEILDQMGFRVETAADGKQGIDSAVEHIGDLSLVLLDVTMPVMGGGEVFTSLRMLKPDLRIILSSGYPQADVMENLNPSESVGFIQKPYTADDLTAKVAELFGMTPPPDRTTT